MDTDGGASVMSPLWDIITLQSVMMTPSIDMIQDHDSQGIAAHIRHHYITEFMMTRVARWRL
jgi:hypothetical protein